MSSKLNKLKKGQFKRPSTKPFKPAGDEGAIMGHSENEPALVVNDLPVQNKEVKKPKTISSNVSSKTKVPNKENKIDETITIELLHKHSADKGFKLLYDKLISGEQTNNTTIALPDAIQDVLHELYIYIWKTEKRKCSNKEIICNAIICSHKLFVKKGLVVSKEQSDIIKGKTNIGTSFTFPLIIQDMLNDIFMATWAKYKRKTNNKEIICTAVLFLHKSILG